MLLADEITAPLDAENAKNIRQLIFDLPVTAIEITHHIDAEFKYQEILELSR